MVKLLLDESIPRKLISLFPTTYDVRTVPMMGWAGTKNGKLLQLAGENGFRALLTADRGIEYQQHVPGLPIMVIVLLAHRTHFKDLMPLVPRVVTLLESDSITGLFRVSG